VFAVGFDEQRFGGANDALARLNRLDEQIVNRRGIRTPFSG
jgi:hypothetical protein